MSLVLEIWIDRNLIRNIVIEKAREIRAKPMDGQISLKGILY